MTPLLPFRQMESVPHGYSVLEPLAVVVLGIMVLFLAFMVLLMLIGFAYAFWKGNPEE